MKIVDVNEFFAERGGGVRTYVLRKLEAAHARGVEMVIVAPGPEDREETRAGGKIVWIKGPPMPFDPRYHVLHRERAVHDVIRREAPSFIEGSSPWSGGWFAARYPEPVARALVFHQDAVAVYPHSLFDRWVAPEVLDRMARPYWGYLRALSACFDRTVVSGHWLEARLRAFGVHAPATVPFGVDRERFATALASPPERARLLARCGVEPDGVLLVAVSRHHPEKRVGTLIDAVARLRRSRAFPRGVGLVVFGDGPLASHLGRMAARTAGVHLAGFTADPTELPRAVASADAFVHGSAAETYGLVVGEALAAGVPIVVPDSGGAAELARPDYAETYRAGDAAACAAAITRLLQRDRESTRAAARQAGQTHVLDAQAHFDRLFEAYESVARRVTVLRTVTPPSANHAGTRGAA